MTGRDSAKLAKLAYTATLCPHLGSSWFFSSNDHHVNSTAGRYIFTTLATFSYVQDSFVASVNDAGTEANLIHEAVTQRRRRIRLDTDEAPRTCGKVCQIFAGHASWRKMDPNISECTSSGYYERFCRNAQGLPA